MLLKRPHIKFLIYFTFYVGLHGVSIQNIYAQRRFRIKNLGVEEGLSHYQVRAIAKDAEGFIWIGTGNGLQRYDGYNLKTYQYQAGQDTILGSNEIRALLSDKNGNLWVGTRGGGLTRIKDGKFERIYYRPQNPYSLPSNDIESIAEGKDGAIWVGTRNAGLCKLLNGKTTQYQHSPEDSTSISSNSVFSLLVADDGTVWAGTYGGGLNKLLPSGKFERFTHNPKETNSLSSNYVISLLEGSNKAIWIGTWEGGLNRLVNGNCYRYNADSLGLKSNSVLSMAKDSKDNVWLATWGEGVLKCDPTGKIMPFNHSPYNQKTLCNNYIETLFMDDNDHLWAGSYSGGVSQVIPGAFESYQATSISEGLGNEYISSIYRKTASSPLWIATYGGGLYCYQDEKFEHFTPNITRGSSIWSIAPSPQGLLLATEAGLLHFADGQFKALELPYQSSSPEKPIYKMHHNKDGSVWLGTRQGEVFKFENEKIVPINIPLTNKSLSSILADSAIFCLFYDSKKRLWTGGDAGIRVIDSTGQAFYPKNESREPLQQSEGKVNTIVEDRIGRIWIGTMHGLYLFHEPTKKLRRIGVQQGLGAQSVVSIQEDGKGTLWLGTLNGLYRFEIYTDSFERYSVADGLPGNSFTQGANFQDSKGRIYFGGLKGMVSFHPDSLERGQIATIRLTDFSILNQPVNALERFGTSLNNLKSIELDYWENSFSLEVSALNYEGRDNTYQYYLEGLEKQSKIAGRRRYANYTNIPPGNYTFHAMLANQPSKGLSIPIRIIPPIWGRLWFQILCGFFLIAVILGSYWYRLNRFKQQKAILEQTVEARTQEINAQKEALEAQAMELAETNSTLKATTEELQLSGQNLLATNRHLEQTQLKLQGLLQKEQEQFLKLQQTQNQLVQSEKMASLGILTAGIAHEINNPINFVMAGSQVLANRVREMAKALHEYEKAEVINADELIALQTHLKSWKQEQYFDSEIAEEAISLTQDILLGAKRIAEIVNSLRAFSRTDNQKVQQVNLHSHLDGTLLILRNQYKDRVEIEKHYDLSLPAIHCFPGKLDQVFMNLIANAIQAIEGKGKVTISTQALNGSHIQVTVTDTGKGISKQDQQRIFDPFFTTKEVGEGTGLGLYISSNIIQEHQGEIEVESTEGKGTTFKVTLPTVLSLAGNKH